MLKQILECKPEAVYVTADLFAAYPVVHALRKKHMPVLMRAKEGRKDPHRAASFGIVDQKERKNNGRVRKPQTGRTEGENPVDRIDFDSPFCVHFCHFV